MELLCTIVIVLLLTSCLTIGIGLATKTFGHTSDLSKAQTLASTLNYLLSDELRTASDLSFADGKLKYQSENHVGVAEMKVDADGHIFVKTNDTEDQYNIAEQPYKLVPKTLYGKNIRVKDDFNVEKNGQIISVHYVIVDKNDKELVTSEFEIKALVD